MKKKAKKQAKRKARKHNSKPRKHKRTVRTQPTQAIEAPLQKADVEITSEQIAPAILTPQSPTAIDGSFEVIGNTATSQDKIDSALKGLEDPFKKPENKPEDKDGNQ